MRHWRVLVVLTSMFFATGGPGLAQNEAYCSQLNELLQSVTQVLKIDPSSLVFQKIKSDVEQEMKRVNCPVPRRGNRASVLQTFLVQFQCY